MTEFNAIEGSLVNYLEVETIPWNLRTQLSHLTLSLRRLLPAKRDL